MSILLIFKIIIIVLSSILVIYVGLVARVFYDEERKEFSYKSLFWTIVSSGLFVGIIYYIDLKFGEKTAFVCAMGFVFVGVLSIPTIINNKISKK
ncbi:hypothetical protein QK289_15650 [Exiguobacterium antarcticum]|uniref:Uncharacterized protein n=1 Tax=Exiguobacterium antarcticum TaxID=132920 RepID=A0ABT6R669_9BACL|nr:hypothetical protein [Exiguobacterium antarcticum]MDI3236450.1 hypothetical protein [Exiguobacterium antarcticum]